MQMKNYVLIQVALVGLCAMVSGGVLVSVEGIPGLNSVMRFLEIGQQFCSDVKSTISLGGQAVRDPYIMGGLGLMGASALYSKVYSKQTSMLQGALYVTGTIMVAGKLCRLMSSTEHERTREHATTEAERVIRQVSDEHERTRTHINGVQAQVASVETRVAANGEAISMVNGLVQRLGEASEERHKELAQRVERHGQASAERDAELRGKLAQQGERQDAHHSYVMTEFSKLKAGLCAVGLTVTKGSNAAEIAAQTSQATRNEIVQLTNKMDQVLKLLAKDEQLVAKETEDGDEAREMEEVD